jgi:3-hydroxyisobutyrate dehydrogenase
MSFGHTCVEVWNEAAQHSTPATDHTELYRLLPGAEQ